MIGRAPIADVIEHSEAFLAPLGGVTGTVVDLGSGGGVPGLVIAWMRPDLSVVLVDRRATRTDHLHRLVHRLRGCEHVTVLNAEAASLPRRLDVKVEAVVARSFGPPEGVLRAAVPILAAGGLLVASSPPSGASNRWPPTLVERYGMRRVDADRRVVVLRRHTECLP